MLTFEQQLQKALRICNELLDEEKVALGKKDLDLLEDVQERKQEAVKRLITLIDRSQEETIEDEQIPERAQNVLSRIQEHSSILATWMEKHEKEMNLATRGKNRLKGVRRKYVAEHQGYLRRSQNFKA